jgi:hypothetical protein
MGHLTYSTEKVFVEFRQQTNPNLSSAFFATESPILEINEKRIGRRGRRFVLIERRGGLGIRLFVLFFDETEFALV